MYGDETTRRGAHLDIDVRALDADAVRALYELLGEDREALAEIVDAFLDEAPRRLAELRRGFDEFDASRHYHEKAMALSPSDAYIKGRSAAFYTFAGEPTRAMELLDEAEELDPFLPVWCVEERVVALYALRRFEEAAAAGRVPPFQTRRSRLYRAASRVALGDRARARQIVAEALATNPDLTTDYIQQRETYRDPTVKRLLIDRLAEAGLPRAAAAAR